ncbi:bifunctional diguanylate cyclase/phosphodiesterase [Pseudomonas huanghezhanensis]|uniref:bifunctional diguanylate cyclase/phosphodiesterase n=1 Tax=Pseudomonas huanghezhanensis TaxID=3002903 RepID=UPI002286190C|nr:EAL domain-containing protein [Pseudomonas sp. BSw22131]
MPENLRSIANSSSVSLARASLLKFSGLLALVFVCAVGLLLYLAHNLNRIELAESDFYARKAVQSLEKSVSLTLKDYAFWGDAYEHLHTRVDTGWAFEQQNLGPTLYPDFGFQGLFVINPEGRTVYSVIEGKMSKVSAEEWLGQPIDGLLSKARAPAGSVSPVTLFVSFRGRPTLLTAAAITPGTDPTVSTQTGPPSVLVFVDMLDPARLQAMGTEYGVNGLHLSTDHDGHVDSIMPLGENGAAGELHWKPERPGDQILGLILPLMGVAAALVWLMTWAILRRTTAAARALDASFDSLQASQAALETSEARFRDVVEASSDWIWEVDLDGRFTYLSERFQSVTGLSREQWLDARIDDLLCTELGVLSQWLSIPNRRSNISVQCRYIDSHGLARITRLSAREIAGLGFRGTATDITEEVEARLRIEYLSQHDALTGLPNRTRLQEFLDGKLKAAPTAEQPLVMLSLDLDRFKPVNDLLGHAAGDRLLNEVSRRIAECIRSGDLVARIGGDEFAMIVTDVGSPDEVEALCRRLIESIELPMQIDEQEVFVSASIGIAMAPNDACEAAELLRYADIALYEAKAAGRNTWRFYAGDMNARIIERRRLESDLRYAIKHGELRLHFQPRFRICDGKMVGAEALVRWQHPSRGLISPDTFIPVAEETGLILPLSNWVLNAACESAAGWPKSLFVSVNLSSIEFQRGNLVERIQQALADTRLEASRLELEITESVMLDDAVVALDIMRALKSLGVRLSMDDFGTGYSSLSYLRSFPFDGLKIDRSFVNRLSESESDQSIIQAIVGLGRALSLTVTAEGIETQAQLELLRAVNCDEGQGFLLSRPLDIQAFNALIGAEAAVT